MLENPRFHVCHVLLAVALTLPACGDDTAAPGPTDAGTSADLCVDLDCSTLDTTCTAGMCNPADGTCMATPRADDIPCDDSDLCTINDVCTAGVCGGTAVDCSVFGDRCNAGMCNPADGSCVLAPVADGTPCDDGDLCSAGTDTCVAGVCGLGQIMDSDVSGTFLYSYETTANLRSMPANFLSLGDEGVSATIPIGFDFDFFGTTFSRLYVAANGFIAFTRPSGSLLPVALPSALVPRNLVALYWADLNPAAGGTITYGISGTAPERELVVMFSEVPHDGDIRAPVTGQIVLHEGTNHIELICIDCAGNGQPHTQGIQNSTATEAHVPTGRNHRSFAVQDEAVMIVSVTSAGPDGYGDSCDTCIAVSNPEQMPFMSGGSRALFAGIRHVQRTLVSPTQLTLSDDQVSAAVPIGFSFEFFGVPQTEVRVSSNGFLTFSNTAEAGCCSGQVLPAPEEPNNLIALYWEDLNPGAGGTISYATLGTEPNREFVVAFADVPHFGSDTAAVTGQIVLRESSNEIELICTRCPFAAEFNPHTQGVEDAMGTYGKTIRGRNGAAFSAASEGVRFETYLVESVCAL